MRDFVSAANGHFIQNAGVVVDIFDIATLGPQVADAHAHVVVVVAALPGFGPWRATGHAGELVAVVIGKQCALGGAAGSVGFAQAVAVVVVGVGDGAAAVCRFGDAGEPVGFVVFECAVFFGDAVVDDGFGFAVVAWVIGKDMAGVVPCSAFGIAGQPVEVVVAVVGGEHLAFGKAILGFNLLGAVAVFVVFVSKAGDDAVVRQGVGNGFYPAGVVVRVGHGGAVAVVDALQPAVLPIGMGGGDVVGHRGFESVAAVEGVRGTSATGGHASAVAVVVVGIADGTVALGFGDQAVKLVVIVIGDFRSAGFVFRNSVDIVIGVVGGDDIGDIAASREGLVGQAVEFIVSIREGLAFRIDGFGQVAFGVVCEGRKAETRLPPSLYRIWSLIWVCREVCLRSRLCAALRWGRFV